VQQPSIMLNVLTMLGTMELYRDHRDWFEAIRAVQRAAEYDIITNTTSKTGLVPKKLHPRQERPFYDWRSASAELRRCMRLARYQDQYERFQIQTFRKMCQPLTSQNGFEFLAKLSEFYSPPYTPPMANHVYKPKRRLVKTPSQPWRETRFFDASKVRWKEYYDVVSLRQLNQCHEEWLRTHAFPASDAKQGNKRKHVQSIKTDNNKRSCGTREEHSADSKANWREKSRCFRRAIQAAKECFIAHQYHVARRGRGCDHSDVFSVDSNATVKSASCTTISSKQLGEICNPAVTCRYGSRYGSTRRWYKTSICMRRAIRALRRLRYVTHTDSRHNKNLNFDECDGQSLCLRSWRRESLELRAHVRAARVHNVVLNDSLTTITSAPSTARSESSCENCVHCDAAVDRNCYSRHRRACYKLMRAKQRLQALMDPKHNEAECYEHVYVTSDGDIICSEHVNIEIETEAADTDTIRELHGCPHCGRKFHLEAFTKHKPVCEKVFMKPLDSAVLNSNTNSIVEAAVSVESCGHAVCRCWRAESVALRCAVKTLRDYLHRCDDVGKHETDANTEYFTCMECKREFDKRSFMAHYEWCVGHQDSARSPKSLFCADAYCEFGCESNKKKLTVVVDEAYPGIQSETNSELKSTGSANVLAFEADLFECQLCGERMGLGNYELHSAFCCHTSTFMNSVKSKF
jgi:hypothetical protein